MTAFAISGGAQAKRPQRRLPSTSLKSLYFISIRTRVHPPLNLIPAYPTQEAGLPTKEVNWGNGGGVGAAAFLSTDKARSACPGPPSTEPSCERQSASVASVLLAPRKKPAAPRRLPPSPQRRASSLQRRAGRSPVRNTVCSPQRRAVLRAALSAQRAASCSNAWATALIEEREYRDRGGVWKVRAGEN